MSSTVEVTFESAREAIGVKAKEANRVRQELQAAASVLEDLTQRKERAEARLADLWLSASDLRAKATDARLDLQLAAHSAAYFSDCLKRAEQQLDTLPSALRTAGTQSR
ncbi:hypothetical protein DIPPA_08741 [Diplonema papillatum]|nr:hypothetical protein DIPPA_08741 [Diplonema papillatum]